MRANDAVLSLGVLASGSGTNLEAILGATRSGTIRARVAVVVCNVADAKALDRAREAGVPAVLVSHKAYGSREQFDAAVVEVLRAHGVECVVLAGFMRIVTSVLLSAFPLRVVNVHPSLLPAFPGVAAQAPCFRKRKGGADANTVPIITTLAHRRRGGAAGAVDPGPAGRSGAGVHPGG